MICATKDRIGCEKCESWDGKCTNPLITNTNPFENKDCQEGVKCEEVSCPANNNGFCSTQGMVNYLKDIPKDIRVKLASTILMTNLKTAFSRILFKKLGECAASIPEFNKKFTSLITSGKLMAILDQNIEDLRKLVTDNIDSILKSETPDELKKKIEGLSEKQAAILIELFKKEIENV